MPRAWLYANWAYFFAFVVECWRRTDGFRHTDIGWPDSPDLLLFAAPIFLSAFALALYSGQASAGRIIGARIDERPVGFWIAAIIQLTLGVVLIAVGVHGPLW